MTKTIKEEQKETWEEGQITTKISVGGKKYWKRDRHQRNITWVGKEGERKNGGKC